MTIFQKYAAESSPEFMISNLAKSHHKRLLYFVLNKVRNEDDAQDIVQSTFVEAIKSMNNFRSESKPETWLTGIALNLIKNHFYQLKNKPIYYIEDEQSCINHHIDEQTPFDILVQKQLAQSIDETFETMPKEMRETAEKVLLNNIKYDKVAILDKIPVGTVRSRVSRARAALKKLKEQHVI